MFRRILITLRGFIYFQGDSGGPFLCDGTIYGILSGGRACGLEGVAVVYTRLEFYYDFIYNTLKSSHVACDSKFKFENFFVMVVTLVISNI